MINKNRKIRLLVSVCMAALAAWPASAESGHISVDRVIERALVESPLVKDITARIAGKRAVGFETRILQNPVLDSEVRFPKSYRDTRGSNEVAVSFSQPLRPSDFGSRSRVDELIQQAATVDEKLELLGFSQRIKLVFAKSWALTQRVGDIKKYLERAAKIESNITRVAESGFISPGERSLFKAEALKARYRLGALLSDLKRSRADLSKIAGFLVTESLQRPQIRNLPSDEALLEQAIKLPVQERAALAVKLANEQLKLAELDAYPKFAPRFVYERTNDYANYVGVGLSIDLPFFDRNRGAKSARAAELSSAQSLSQYFSGAGFAEDVKALRASIETSTTLLSGYDKEILPTLREAVISEERLLSSGQGSFFRVWQTLRELSSAEAETVERTVSVFADRAELSVLTGTDF